jgi:hypothetical protein
MAIAKGWHETLIIAGIVIAGLVEAVEQALAAAPNFTALFPAFLHGEFWHYIPLTFLIAAGLVWLHGKLFSPKDKPRLNQARNLVVPTIGLTLRSASFDPYVHNPNILWPRQLALYFSNDGDEIHLGVGKWIKDHIGIQVDRPSRFVYFRKNNLGKWEGEATDKIVYSGNWVKISVGLDSSVPDSELKTLADEIRLGTLEIPCEISGTPIKIRTNIAVSQEVLSRL